MKPVGIFTLLIATSAIFGEVVGAVEYGQASIQETEVAALGKIAKTLKAGGVLQAQSALSTEDLTTLCHGKIDCAFSDWQDGLTSQGRSYKYKTYELTYGKGTQTCKAAVTAYTGRFKAMHGGSFCGVPLPLIHMLTDPFYCPEFSPKRGGTASMEWPQDEQWEDQPFVSANEDCK